MSRGLRFSGRENTATPQCRGRRHPRRHKDTAWPGAVRFQPEALVLGPGAAFRDAGGLSWEGDARRAPDAGSTEGGAWVTQQPKRLIGGKATWPFPPPLSHAAVTVAQPTSGVTVRPRGRRCARNPTALHDHGATGDKTQYACALRGWATTRNQRAPALCGDGRLPQPARAETARLRSAGWVTARNQRAPALCGNG